MLAQAEQMPYCRNRWHLHCKEQTNALSIPIMFVIHFFKIFNLGESFLFLLRFFISIGPVPSKTTVRETVRGEEKQHSGGIRVKLMEEWWHCLFAKLGVCPLSDWCFSMHYICAFIYVIVLFCCSDGECSRQEYQTITYKASKLLSKKVNTTLSQMGIILPELVFFFLLP